MVVVTPSTDESWVEAMGVLQQRGVKLAAILLEPDTFGSSETSLGVFASLAAIDVFTYMVQQSDDLLTSRSGRRRPAKPSSRARQRRESAGCVTPTGIRSSSAANGARRRRRALTGDRAVGRLADAADHRVVFMSVVHSVEAPTG